MAFQNCQNRKYRFALGTMNNHLVRENVSLPRFEIFPNPTTVVGADKGLSCTEFFNGFTQRYPVFAPQTTPIYSNAAFRILSYVVEAVTGQTFASVVQQQILTPLQLADTSLSIPPASTGVIPLSESVSGWNMGLGDEVA